MTRGGELKVGKMKREVGKDTNDKITQEKMKWRNEMRWGHWSLDNIKHNQNKST